MNQSRIYVSLFVLLLPAFLLCQNIGATLDIQIQHRVNKEILRLDSGLYRNSLNQTFHISKLRYYISHVSLVYQNGEYADLPGVFLVDEDLPDTKRLHFGGVPVGSLKSIRFMLGVDSLHNCSGAQSGALDPAHGMFWTWNSGYIFLKLEGHSPNSTAPGHFFEYHIGGYKAPANCIRTVSLPINTGLNNGESKTLHLFVNVMEILQGPSTVDFSQLPSVTDGRYAEVIANNYLDMFSFGE
jgi:hypothetical protein